MHKGINTTLDEGQTPIIAFTGDGVIADPISAHEARTYTHEGTTFRLHNCVGQPFTKAKRAQSSVDDETWVPGEVAPTQNQFDVGDTRAPTVVAFTQNSRDEVRQINGDGQITGALSAEAGMHQTNYIAFANRTRDGIKVPEVMKDGVTPALTNPGAGGRGDAVNVACGLAVRRLTPRECERLQGFPDDYTAITYRGKPAADGPRYRALGNSMAVPVMRWIGERLAKVEALA